MSYRGQFDEYLDNVVRGRDEVVRRALFWDWAGSRVFDCEGCLDEFTPEWEGLEEDAEVRCPKCGAWDRGYRQGVQSAKGAKR